MPTQQIYSQGLSKKPLVSFIITTYNLPINLLIECLQSVFSLSLGQDEREIILVDDGSDVCTLQELGAYQNQLTYIRQTNQGAAAARNLGLKVANGMYVQFIDGDDALIPFSYEHCLDIIRYKNADVVSFAASSSKKGQQCAICARPHDRERLYQSKQSASDGVEILVQAGHPLWTAIYKRFTQRG